MRLLTALFVCTNGAGLGHLSRCLAYARRLPEQVTPYFFSLASAVEIIHDMGFKADYFVSPNWTTSTSNDWNSELSLRLGLVLERVRPDVVVFDGTWPYKGLVMACKRYGRARMVWSCRGLHLKGKEKLSPDGDLFDLIIQPGELGACVEEGISGYGSRLLKVPPVLLMDEAGLLDREQARRSLGLGEGNYALFSLGAGNINDVGGLVSDLVGRFEAAGYTVVFASNPISIKDVSLPGYVQSISEYPLARYMRAFDLFVGAAGYNTCCELVQAQIPSLLIPNTNTRLDDQSRRALLVAEYAPAIVSACDSEEQREEAVAQVLERMVRPRNPVSAIALNGANLAADAIFALAHQRGCA